MSFLNELAHFVDKGRAVLSVLSEEQESIREKRFKGKEIEERLGLPLSTIYIDEEKGKLPLVMERDERMRRMGYTLKEITHLQDHYGTSPRRREGEAPVTLAFTNQKGGSWKTTTASYAASYYANLGYRVLMVDLDPQASSTENIGLQPNIKIHGEHTMAPFIREDEEVQGTEVASIVRDTHISNLKIIPSSLEMGHCDYDLTLKMSQANLLPDHQAIGIRKLELFTRVRSLIDEVSDNFDIIIIDGTPSLGLLPVNIILSSDILVIPVPTESTDFAATISFCDLVHAEGEVIAEHLGEHGVDQLFPEMIVVPTRYSPSNTSTISSDEMLAQIHNVFGDKCSKACIRKHDAVISNLSLIRRTVFDVNPGIIKTSFGDLNIKSDARKRAIENYVEVFDEILNRNIKPYWESRLEEHEAWMAVNYPE